LRMTFFMTGSLSSSRIVGGEISVRLTRSPP
jgi:hypothetical protein